MEMVRQMRATAVGALLAALILSVPSKGLAQDEAAEIRALIGKTWDRPDETVVTEPVVIVEGSAVAGWSQGGRGGRALLKREQGAWRVVLCSGDALKEADSLAQTGIAQETAQALAAALAKAEQSLSEERRALLSSFEGIMHMDGGHDPHHDDHHHHKH
jgi:hypothetical protein